MANDPTLVAGGWTLVLPTNVWASHFTYGVGTVVLHSGLLWQCAVSNINSEPTFTNPAWNQIATAIAAATAAPVDAVAGSASIGAGGTPATGNTVVVNGITYTFRTALTPLDYEVLINGQDGSLTNLEHAINNSGGTPGTDYQVPAANPYVTAADVASHAIALTAIIAGVVGNSYTLTKVGTNLSVVTFATSATGINGTVGFLNQMIAFGGQPYFCTAAATIATAGSWKKISLASL